MASSKRTARTRISSLEAEAAAQLRQIEELKRRQRNAIDQTEIYSGTGSAIPDELTDLDTTVTGAQLNAKHLAGAASTSTALGTTISATYSQSEVQGIVDKLDELIGYFSDLVGILDTAQITGVVTSFIYLRPGGVDEYRRPGGVDQYLRP